MFPDPRKPETITGPISARLAWLRLQWLRLDVWWHNLKIGAVIAADRPFGGEAAAKRDGWTAATIIRAAPAVALAVLLEALPALGLLAVAIVVTLLVPGSLRLLAFVVAVAVLAVAINDARKERQATGWHWPKILLTLVWLAFGGAAGALLMALHETTIPITHKPPFYGTEPAYALSTLVVMAALMLGPVGFAWRCRNRDAIKLAYWFTATGALWWATFYTAYVQNSREVYDATPGVFGIMAAIGLVAGLIALEKPDSRLADFAQVRRPSARAASTDDLKARGIIDEA